MKDRLMNMENLECPCCGEPFEDDTIEQLCMEPFNGICVECDTCKDEYSLTMMVNLSYIGNNSEEE